MSTKSGEPHSKEVDGTGSIAADPARIAAWRISFSGSQSLSVLYALSPDQQAQAIKAAHIKSAVTVLSELGGCIVGGGAERGYMGMVLDDMAEQAHPDYIQLMHERATNHALEPKSFPLCGYIVFSSAASQNQAPKLETTAFLLNVTKDQGKVRMLADAKDIDQFTGPLREAYEGALDFYVWKAIGMFHRVPGVNELQIEGVPQDVVQKFNHERLAFPVGSNGQQAQPLPERQLFSAWREQGEKFGWGPKQAEALLRGIKREQAWSEFKSECAIMLRGGREFLGDAIASLAKLIKGEKHQEYEKPKSKENGPTQSH